MPTPKPRIADHTLFAQKVEEGLNTTQLAKFFDVNVRTIHRTYLRFKTFSEVRVGSYEGFKGTLSEVAEHFGVPRDWFYRVERAVEKGTSYDVIFEIAVEKFRNAQKEKETKRAREELNSISSLARTASRGGRHTGHAG